MTQKELDALKEADSDGLLIYEYIANNAGTTADNPAESAADTAALCDALCQVDRTGQFTASAARFLNAVAPEEYAQSVRALVAATIDRDREHRYLPELMECIYGSVTPDQAAQLSLHDSNFRRMYKRLYSDSPM